MKVEYYTITEGFDWGPAVSKLVIKNIKAIDFKDLDIRSIRTVPNDQTGQLENINMPCEVIEIYRSDINGKKSDSDEYVTICLKVGPEKVENAAFHYSSLRGRNAYVDINYTFGLECEIEKLGNFEMISDELIHNQLFKSKDIELTYASFTPNLQDDQKVPLIIWLHGAGEGGFDTRLAVLGNKVTSLAKKEIQDYFGINGAFVLVPQTPTMWMDWKGDSIYNIDQKNSDGQSYYTEALMALIDFYVKDNPQIDKGRIYLGGCSNGGYMTVQMLVNYPDYFAAAFPVCQAYHVDWLSESRLNSLKNIPIWLVHSKNDPVIPIHSDYSSSFLLESTSELEPQLIDHFSNALFNRLKDLGSKNIHYSLFDKVIDTSGKYFDDKGKPYEYHGHFSWIYVFNDECYEVINGEKISLFQWLSNQYK